MSLRELTELEVYNRFENEVRVAETLQELEDAGNWLAGIFLVNPDYKEVLRFDLSRIYKRKLDSLSRKTVGVIEVKGWFAKKIGMPREIEVRVVGETDKAIRVKSRATTTPTDRCRHCGRKLTHPVSVLYGIGPECGKHYHIPDNIQDVDKIRKLLRSVTYEGWIPKSVIIS